MVWPCNKSNQNVLVITTVPEDLMRSPNCYEKIILSLVYLDHFYINHLSFKTYTYFVSDSFGRMMTSVDTFFRINFLNVYNTMHRITRKPITLK